jgi:hypothetical protein
VFLIRYKFLTKKEFLKALSEFYKDENYELENDKKINTNDCSYLTLKQVTKYYPKWFCK